MKSIFRYLSPPSQCGYLPDQAWSLEYEHFMELRPEEYAVRLLQGWRRFGYVAFRPRCPVCSACQSLRVDVVNFTPNRSQRRVRKRNEGSVRLEIHEPCVSPEKLALYDRFHKHQAEWRGWPDHGDKDEGSYESSFVENPFPTEEWRYFIADRLVGVGYVDVLPIGLSAIYYFHEPEERSRSLGIWNVLCLVESARQRRLPHLYLGYFVRGCRSMQYKGGFPPSEVHTSDHRWRPFSPPAPRE